jgi:hypothetical protein
MASKNRGLPTATRLPDSMRPRWPRLRTTTRRGKLAGGIGSAGYCLIPTCQRLELIGALFQNALETNAGGERDYGSPMAMNSLLLHQ